MRGAIQVAASRSKITLMGAVQVLDLRHQARSASVGRPTSHVLQRRAARLFSVVSGGKSARIERVDEWETTRATLTARGVPGAADLGRFVSNVEFFRPSDLDERAAMPVLIELLPTLTDRKLINAVAGHLRRPWARPAAFEQLHAAFVRLATVDDATSWGLGDSMSSAARIQELPLLLQIVRDPGYGRARQMVVFSLARFKRSPDVKSVLIALLTDEDVALHAMGALRANIGSSDALPYLRDVEARHHGEPLGQTAARQIRKAEKSIRVTAPLADRAR
ncbi:MAG: hypothetical protein DLM57_15625 [Pseudonocardiales bacterium]|nr:MAG: hypothetical protein DLM57_15625 [Pseudonocardiales bacterium]